MTARPFAMLLALAAGHVSAFAASPDLIVHHGKIVTVDGEFSLAQALAVTGKRITAVGNNADVLQLAGPETERLDLGGKTVLPGLIDSHVHPVGAAMYEFDHPVPEMTTIADVLDYVAARAKILDDGQWIHVSQVFITRLREQRFPTRAELDRAAPKNPVVFRTGPDAALNSLALKESGIDRDFRVNDGRPGHVERDPETGELTGILRSCSRFIKSMSSGKRAGHEDRYARLKALFADYNAVGITSIADRAAGGSAVELYRELRDNGDLTCRVFVSRHIGGGTSEERIAELAQSPLHEHDDMLWLRGVKVFLDGGMLTGSAYMRKPWGVSKIYSITDPAYRGMLYIQPDQLYRVARAALKHDLQFTAHAVGDGAVHTLIDAYARIDKEFPVRKARPCITHCNFMSAEAIRSMQKLGIVADMQPAWLYLDGATLKKQFGDERLTYFQPYKTLFERGVRVGGGSDHMQKIGSLRSVNPYNPFLGMWITLTRQPRWTDVPLHPEQRLTRAQAIRFYTTGNAWLTFEEQHKGSLEPGKLADFIVLDRDILSCPLEEVKDIQVQQTFLGGRSVYRKR